LATVAFSYVLTKRNIVSGMIPGFWCQAEQWWWYINSK
jgi:cytochrome b